MLTGVPELIASTKLFDEVHTDSPQMFVHITLQLPPIK